MTNGASQVFSSTLHGKGVDWASYQMIMVVTRNPSSTMKTNIIVFTLTFFKPFRRNFIGKDKFKIDS